MSVETAIAEIRGDHQVVGKQKQSLQYNFSYPEWVKIHKPLEYAAEEDAYLLMKAEGCKGFHEEFDTDDDGGGGFGDGYKGCGSDSPPPLVT